jgi:hypothetical protein
MRSSSSALSTFAIGASTGLSTFAIGASTGFPTFAIGASAVFGAVGGVAGFGAATAGGSFRATSEGCGFSAFSSFAAFSAFSAFTSGRAAASGASFFAKTGGLRRRDAGVCVGRLGVGRLGDRLLRQHEIEDDPRRAAEDQLLHRRRAAAQLHARDRLRAALLERDTPDHRAAPLELSRRAGGIELHDELLAARDLASLDAISRRRVELEDDARELRMVPDPNLDHARGPGRTDEDCERREGGRDARKSSEGHRILVVRDPQRGPRSVHFG